ncbi:hypothetical protein Tco_0848353 [Tanacetum coccineum]
MSSGRRRNGPRPSHGDICWSGSGTRGVEQMLLDDHQEKLKCSNGANGPGGANGSACENMAAWENGLTGANGLARSNRSAGSKASTGVGESNEESYQAGMVESHGENAESNPHNEELRNKAYNAFDPIVFVDRNTFD